MRGIAHDPAKNCYYLTDMLRQSIISLSSQDAAETELVNEYEGAPLVGPHSLIVSNHSGMKQGYNASSLSGGVKAFLAATFGKRHRQ